MSAEEFQAAVKRAIQLCGGSVKDAAHVLGMHPSALSHALNHRGLCDWWARVKRERIAENQRAKGRRRYRRKKLRALLESGYDQVTAEYLAAQDGRRVRRAFTAPTAGEGAPTLWVPEALED
jgi:hypothetical protein